MDTLMDVTYHNDSYEYDPSLYSASPEQAQTNRSDDPELVQPGFYRVRIVSGGRKKNRRTGEEIRITDKRTNEKTPLLQIHRIEILDPEEFTGMSYGVWQDVFTSNSPVRDRKTNEPIDGKWIVEGFTILAGIDLGLMSPNSGTEGYNENLQELVKQLENAKTLRPTLTVRLAYEGFDTAYHAQLVAGGMDDKAARKAAKITSPGFKNADGTYRLETTGLSGETVKAKLVIKEYVPSNGRVTLGPLKPRRAA
jgi:hypothetical protein